MLFDEEIYRDDRKLLDFDNSNIIFRKAVRAIIVSNRKILMVLLEKTTEYKFPGGGVEENENAEEALKREVLEEVGYNVIKVVEKIGTVTEYAIAKEGKGYIFKMVSEYYTVHIDNNQINQTLDDYEKEFLYKPCWTEMETAYYTNRKLIDNKLDSTPWIKRETKVLEIIKDKLL
jgi:8-oxo-dGTP pyrophosphatase MutT (NUDIX family)